ncbi:pilus assembly protein TadG-related protein [Rhizobium sp.]
MTVRAADFTTRAQNLYRRLLLDRAGNIAMSFAVVSVPLLAAVGVGVDYVRALNVQREMQGSLDAALVAAVKNVGTKDDTELKKILANWMSRDPNNAGAYQLDANSVVIDKSKETLTATVRATVPTTFLRIIGRNDVPVAAKASIMGGSTVTKSAVSMYLVLDQSTSMGWDTDTTYTGPCANNKNNTCTKKYTKMESLKLAVSSLLTTFDTADPTKKFVRTAAVSYSDKMQTPTIMDWGTAKVATYMSKLGPNGLTDSSGAMAEAFSVLGPESGTNSENSIHNKKNGADVTKYIVLMTDGDNTMWNKQRTEAIENPAADTATKKTCDDAKATGIIIYSVAFMAPVRGKELLNYCATSDKHYFDVKDTAGIINAFRSIGESSANNLVRLTN